MDLEFSGGNIGKIFDDEDHWQQFFPNYKTREAKKPLLKKPDSLSLMVFTVWFKLLPEREKPSAT